MRLTLLTVLALLPACSLLAQSEGNGWNRLMLKRERGAALEAFDRGEYAFAAANIEALLDRYPKDSEERAELLFKQGEAYFYIKNYSDAARAFESYAAEYPEGPSLAQAGEELVRVRAAQSEPNPAARERIEAARASVEALQALEREHPADPRVKYYLGNAHYDAGDYKKAGECYFAAQSLEAAYAEKELIRDRLVINEHGQPEAQTPERIAAIERERTPLIIYDKMNTYRRDETNAFNTAPQTIYAITGKVRNQASRPVRGVDLEIRFFNALKAVLDTQTVHIGDMGAGDVRSFIARTSQAGNVLNIADFEVTPKEARP